MSTLRVPNPDELASVESLLEHFEHLEAQLPHVRDSLQHSHRLATLGTIASIIAHEYNNILTPMISYAQLALAKPDDHELLLKAVEKALAGAERAAHISSSLLGFAREADERHAARLPETIDEAINCLGRDPRKDGIDLVINVPDVQVAISPLNLEQVVVNLVFNARKAMHRTGGTIRITGKATGAMVYLEVSDTGPGIPPAVLDRIFEPFVTAPADGGDADAEDDTSSRSPRARKGTGLGLCICRDLIRSAGGSIHVESRPGEGATFRITLPVAEDLFE